MSAAIRVAFVVHTFDIGGLERCIANIVNALPPDLYHPLLVCLARNGSAADWIERDDVPVIELRKSAGNDPTVARRLAEVLESEAVDIVHSHNWGTLIESTVATRWMRRTPHVHAQHGLELDPARSSGWRRLVRRYAIGWAMNRIERVAACAHCVRAWLVGECGVRALRVDVLANGVLDPVGEHSAQRGLALRGELGVPDGAILAGSVGRLDPVKNFEACLDATAALPDLHFVLVGDGPERDRIEAHAAGLGIADRVHLVGRQDDVGSWLRAMDVYVNSSRSEAMNLGILEAMAAALPVVATDVGDARRILTGDQEAGLIVDPDDSRALEAALRELAGDPDRRARLARHSREQYESNYCAERMVARYDALYKELIRNRIG